MVERVLRLLGFISDTPTSVQRREVRRLDEMAAQNEAMFDSQSHQLDEVEESLCGLLRSEQTLQRAISDDATLNREDLWFRGKNI